MDKLELSKSSSSEDPPPAPGPIVCRLLDIPDDVISQEEETNDKTDFEMMNQTCLKNMIWSCFQSCVSLLENQLICSYFLQYSKSSTNGQKFPVCYSLFYTAQWDFSNFLIVLKGPLSTVSSYNKTGTSHSRHPAKGSNGIRWKMLFTKLSISGGNFINRKKVSSCRKMEGDASSFLGVLKLEN